MIPGIGHLSYEERNEILHLWTLKERRNRADLIQVFKMHNGMLAPCFGDFFEIDLRGRTRGHPLKLVKHK